MTNDKKTIQSIKDRYSKEAVSKIRERTGITNIHAIPAISHIVVHSGVGKHRAESGYVDDVKKGIELITGQRPASRPARKSIAGFKLREGQQAGLMTTLRGERMYSFIDRLVHIALPRSRDFQGVSANTIDAVGNLSIGIRDASIFPELPAEVVDRQFGLQVTLVTTAKNKEEAHILFSELGFPFTKDQDES